MIQEEKIFDFFKNWANNSDNYPGALFSYLYNKCPNCYKFYYTHEKKLTYVNSIENFHPIRKSIETKIDTRKVIKNILNDSKFASYVIPYSPQEYIIIGKEYDFIMMLASASEGSISSYYEEVFCTKQDIKNVFNFISKYFEEAEKEENVEFGIAAIDQTGYLYTTYYDYKCVNIDINKNYNNDFPYERLRDLIENEGNSELILLYGEPGTGKTSLIKHFISEFIDKDFVFIDGTLLANASQEKLMAYMLENKDTIFILEDCEKALTNRDNGYNPVMPILLNITDGIIGDVLGIKLICTFNTKLSNIDPALLRKGRLSFKYEFKKLSKEKTRILLNDNTINEEMTLADIYNYKEENDYSKKSTKKIGF